MKESEARTKRCCGPFPCGRPTTETKEGLTVRAYDAFIDGLEYGGNSAQISVSDRYCIGSECMAWNGRWNDGHCGLVRK